VRTIHDTVQELVCDELDIDTRELESLLSLVRSQIEIIISRASTIGAAPCRALPARRFGARARRLPRVDRRRRCLAADAAISRRSRLSPRPTSAPPAAANRAMPSGYAVLPELGLGCHGGECRPLHRRSRLAASRAPSRILDDRGGNAGWSSWGTRRARPMGAAFPGAACLLSVPWSGAEEAVTHSAPGPTPRVRILGVYVDCGGPKRSETGPVYLAKVDVESSNLFSRSK
jgi:hypothetical protein